MGHHEAADLKGRVVVITGASAGVGRATALAFAAAGAKLALIARDRDALEATRAELASTGAEAIILPLDVADADAVFAAARDCEARLGPIDVWVNNAMATVFSPVKDLTPEEVRRVTEVTYLGNVHGTMAALRHMRERDRGVIVQVGSSLAYRGIPLQSAYCGAKHAIRGFTDSLRTELDHSGSGIRITAVHLPAINTPQFDWARTHRRKMPRPVAPVFAPAVAARAIVHAARRPTREYWLGRMTPLVIFGNMLFPGFMDRYLARQAVDGQARARDVPTDHLDNLFRPVTSGHRTEGSFGDEAQPDALLISAPKARAALAVGLCLVGGLAGAAIGASLASGDDRGARHRLPRLRR
ncbi:MAG TPA: SDR family oxidoreductase [Aurantimonas sp.]|jgi:NAD(P)-dependent dehydrogenase (short-subunit alcohol dehydrogenase family)|nr:SDR family oxidoreductase [Aurantimonas sp.]